MNNLWKNLSIVKKTFAIFALVFVAFLTIWMLGQSLFFGKYYEEVKVRSLSKAVDRFSGEYLNLSDHDEINTTIVKYANSTDAYYAVTAENGEVLHMVSYEMVIKSDVDKRLVKFTLDSAIHDDEFLGMNLKKGEKVTVEYFSADNNQGSKNIYFPNTIKYKKNEWKNDTRPWATRRSNGYQRSQSNEQGTHFFKDLKEYEVSGEIMSITLPNQQSSKLIIQQNHVAYVMMNFRQRLYSGEFFKENDEENYIFNSGNGFDEYNVQINKVRKNGNTEYVCAILPMRNISEAIVAVRDFSWFLFGFMFILMFVIAGIFSRAITKSIIDINNTTEKMKMLDFSQKCKADSRDELGRLAGNINEMSEKLDQTINELTIANEQLTKDIELERKLEEQRKEFVAAASHELKTPLAIIRAYSEGLVDGVFKNKEEHYLSVIIEETQKMDRLILDMIENSRLEGKNLEINKKEYNLCDFVKKVADRFVSPCKAQDITLTIKISEKPVVKTFDAGLIEQVITNFITNAMKHTKKGLIEIGVDEDCVWVFNEGENIPDDEIEKIWDKFYKIDKSRERCGGGSGLGLSIAKNILVLHNAIYKVENTKTGVRFSFSL